MVQSKSFLVTSLTANTPRPPLLALMRTFSASMLIPTLSSHFSIRANGMVTGLQRHCAKNFQITESCLLMHLRQPGARHRH